MGEKTNQLFIKDSLVEFKNRRDELDKDIKAAQSILESHKSSLNDHLNQKVALNVAIEGLEKAVKEL